jgi:hypothetical protein
MPGTSNLITASASGDTNYLGSATTAGIAITVSPLDFAFTLESANEDTIQPGKAASYKFLFAPLYGLYDGPITFKVVGLPSNVIATITPSNLPTDAGPSSVHLTIQTTSQAAYQGEPSRSSKNHGSGLAALFFLTYFGYRKRRIIAPHIAVIFLIAAGFCSVAALNGCATIDLQQASKTYSLHVVASSGSVEHTQAVILTMQ